MLDNLTWAPFLMKGCVRQSSDVPFDPDCSVILKNYLFVKKNPPGVQESNFGCVKKFLSNMGKYLQVFFISKIVVHKNVAG